MDVRLNAPSCSLKSDRHYCTFDQTQSDISTHLDSIRNNYPKNLINNMNLTSLNLCEEYPPSYILKEDQVNTYKTQLKKLRISKKIMKQTMKQIDDILGEQEDEEKDPIDEFFKSDKSLSSSLNISSLKHLLPVNSEKNERNKKETEYKEEIIFVKNGMASNPSSLFDLKIDTRKAKDQQERKRSEIKRPIISAGFNMTKYKPKSILKK